jgi:hypothetical protein
MKTFYFSKMVVTICSLFIFCGTFATASHAATITVMNTNDSGSGSLRQALADANDGDTIDFSVTTPATITLTSGQLEVSKSITISGPGANLLAADANHNSRVFAINSGLTVTISGLTITNGSTTGHGGGIVNGSTLTVSNCTLSGNSARGFFGGGGIYNDHATLTVNNSTLSGNSAGAFAAALGGGIFNDGVGSSATLTVSNSTISGNSATFYGGGIYNDNATLTVSNSTISGNSAAGGNGGGIINDGVGGSATLTVSNSTISGNSAVGSGGIFNEGSSGNATLSIGGTILKAGASGANIVNDSGTVNSNGYNLSSDDESAYLNQTGDQNSTDPMLGPLAYYGGPTATHILKTGSPAIDAGDPNFTPPPSYDQRGVGFARVVNGRIDIGAFERQASDIDPTLIVTKTADTMTAPATAIAVCVKRLLPQTPACRMT